MLVYRKRLICTQTVVTQSVETLIPTSSLRLSPAAMHASKLAPGARETVQ